MLNRYPKQADHMSAAERTARNIAAFILMLSTALLPLALTYYLNGRVLSLLLFITLSTPIFVLALRLLNTADGISPNGREYFRR